MTGNEMDLLLWIFGAMLMIQLGFAGWICHTQARISGTLSHMDHRLTRLEVFQEMERMRQERGEQT